MRKLLMRIQFLALLALAGTWSGCEDIHLTSVTNQLDLFFPEGSLQVDTFSQKTSAKIDILWIIDNSGTMIQEQANLANNFDAFIEVVENSSVDYQIGVISTDMENIAFAGKLQGNPRIIQAGPDARTQFAANVQVGIDGAGKEKGLEAAYMALSEPLLSGYNAGFLRHDAALAVIFVSDEDDKSFNVVNFFHRTFETLKGAGNENRVVGGAIVGDRTDGCSGAGGTAAPGERYHDLVQAMGGSVGSICEGDFSNTLNQLGLTVAGLDRRFSLSDESPEVASIVVKVDGVEVAENRDTGWTFENGSIFFSGSYVPPPKAVIEVSYLHPRRDFILSKEPNLSSIKVYVYAPGAADCTSHDQCPLGSCGFEAGKCDGVEISPDLTNGWVLESELLAGATNYIIAFQGLYFPPGGSTVAVIYSCVGGCR